MEPSNTLNHKRTISCEHLPLYSFNSSEIFIALIARTNKNSYVFCLTESANTKNIQFHVLFDIFSDQPPSIGHIHYTVEDEIYPHSALH